MYVYTNYRNKVILVINKEYNLEHCGKGFFVNKS